MNKDAYLIVRLAIAISMFGHGLVRLPKLETFAEGMVVQFSETMLPAAMVLPFGYILPIAELIVGALLLFGLMTRAAAWAGAMTMFALMLGTCLLEAFGNLTSQLVHTLFFVILIQFQHSDVYSLDRKLGIGRRTEKLRSEL